MKIAAIKTKKGYYITDNLDDKKYFNSLLGILFFDGEKPRATFLKNWCFVPSQPQKLERLISQPSINHRFELIDESMVSDKLPLGFQSNDVLTEEGEWATAYKHLKSLYKFVMDEQPDILEDVEFVFEVVLELDEIQRFNGFSYPIQKTRYAHEGLVDITQQHVQYQLLDKILFPSIVLPSRPCQLTSEQSYKIVRQYIKQHINLEVAQISSDYNFCFAVEKLVMLQEPYTSQTEVLNARGKSYRKKCYRERYVRTRAVKVFEMTWSPENYRNYTPIQPFQGEDWEDLEAKIDEYCKELIDLINTPLKECPHCNGMGVMEE